MLREGSDVGGHVKYREHGWHDHYRGDICHLRVRWMMLVHQEVLQRGEPSAYHHHCNPPPPHHLMQMCQGNSQLNGKCLSSVASSEVSKAQHQHCHPHCQPGTQSGQWQPCQGSIDYWVSSFDSSSVLSKRWGVVHPHRNVLSAAEKQSEGSIQQGGVEGRVLGSPIFPGRFDVSLDFLLLPQFPILLADNEKYPPNPHGYTGLRRLFASPLTQELSSALCISRSGSHTRLSYLEAMKLAKDVRTLTFFKEMPHTWFNPQPFSFHLVPPIWSCLNVLQNIHPAIFVKMSLHST